LTPHIVKLRGAPESSVVQNATDPVLRLASLYAGRRDVQGAEGGACLRRPVTLGHYRGHLQGRIGLGIYPLMPDGTCSWAAVDIDTGDLGAALNLQRLLRDLELPVIVLTSRARGYHVTVFFAEWASAHHARRLLRVVSEEAGLPLDTEIFPKADIAESIGAGGYLRLPYVGALPEGRPGRYTAASGRRVALDPSNVNRRLPLLEFLDLAESSRIAPEVLDRAYETLTLEGSEDRRFEARSVPPPSRPTADAGSFGLSVELATLLRDGWAEGSPYRSRSEAQQAVVNGLVHAGHNDEQIRALLSCPDYGISARALESPPGKRAADLDRCIKKARASHVGGILPHSNPALTIELHRRLLEARMPPLAWPAIAEIAVTTDWATGLSRVTANSLARQLGVGPATIYRTIKDLRRAGFLEAVPFERTAGQWGRVAHRLAASALHPPSRSTGRSPRKAAESVRYEKTITGESRSMEASDKSAPSPPPTLTSETRRRLSPVRVGEMVGMAP
jgi:hypothetical protein